MFNKDKETKDTIKCYGKNPEKWEKHARENDKFKLDILNREEKKEALRKQLEKEKELEVKREKVEQQKEFKAKRNIFLNLNDEVLTSPKGLIMTVHNFKDPDFHNLISAMSPEDSIRVNDYLIQKEERRKLIILEKEWFIQSN